MNVTELKNEGLKREYRVAVPSDQIEAQVVQNLIKLAPRVKIDGFRAGKVPMQVLKQHYGASALEEVRETLIRTHMNQLLAAHKITPAMPPQVTIDSSTKDFAFTLSFELLPQVYPQPIEDVQLEKFAMSFDKKEVDEALEESAKNKFVHVPISEKWAVKKDDVVIVSFSRKLANGQLVEDKDFTMPVRVGSSGLGEAFENQLESASVGDVISLGDVAPSKGTGKKQNKTLETSFLTIHEIHETKPAQVDDLFAKQNGFESLKAWQEKIHKDLEVNYASLARMMMKRQLLDSLAEKHDFDIPECMVSSEFENIWNQLETSLKNGEKREDVLGEDSEKSEDELRKEYRRIADRRVRLGLLLAEIGRQQKIVVSPEELKKAILNEASRYPGNENQVIEFYTQNTEMMAQLRAPIFEEKVVDYLFAVVKVLETQIDANKFKKKMEEL